MALALQIHPAADVLPMYGELDTSSAYSLSGHISISVTSPFSLFEPRKTARLLLQSITLTFEGQSEVITPTSGYAALRLCTITRELAPPTPIELSNEGHENSSEPCVWNVVFNLPIPGWLPASNAIGAESAGTSYALHASAKYSAVEEESPASSWSFLSLCAPFRYRVRTAEAQRSITIARFIAAPKAEISEPSILNYLVNSTSTAEAKETKDKPRIPADVLAKIQVLASVPEYIDVNDGALSLTLRLRTKDLCEEECKKLQVTEVGVDIIQREKVRFRPSATCRARFPIPPNELQPPNTPLRDPHPLCSIYDVAMFVSSDYSESVSRTFSLLPPDENGVYSLSPDNYVFANDAVPRPDGAPPTWYTMDTCIPFVQSTGGAECWGKYDTTEVEYQGLEWAGPKDLRPTTGSPLYSAIHELSVSLTCTYDLQGRGGKVAREKLGFKVPLTFGRVVPRITSAAAEGEPVVLPIYSELYDVNGERKIDYSTPLPLYSPRVENEGSSESDAEDGDSAAANASSSVSVYHGFNDVDTDVDKRHTQVLVAGERCRSQASNP